MFVGVNVSVAVGVGVNVSVAVAVGVSVAVFVGVLVAVLVGVAAAIVTLWVFDAALKFVVAAPLAWTTQVPGAGSAKCCAAYKSTGATHHAVCKSSTIRIVGCRIYRKVRAWIYRRWRSIKSDDRGCFNNRKVAGRGIGNSGCSWCCRGSLP